MQQRRQRRDRGARVRHMHDVNLLLKRRLRQRGHRFADEQNRFDARVKHRPRQLGVIARRVVAQLAHRAQHRDMAPRLLRQHRQRRAHRRRVGVVALVDDQREAVARRGMKAGAASRQAAQLRQRQAGEAEVAPRRVDRRQHRQRVRHPVRAGLRQREAQLALPHPRGDETAADRGAHRLQRPDIGALPAPERDDPRAVPSGRRDQPVAMAAVVRDDRGASRFQPLEDFRLGVGDTLLVGEELDMRGADIGDDGDVRADQAGQRGDLAGVVHPHLQHREAAVGGHPREAERYAGMVIVALDRAMHPAGRAAFQRRRQRLLGTGLADRAGDADHRCLRAGAGGAGEVVERAGGVGDADMRVWGVLTDQRAGGALRERLVEETMPVGTLAGQRHEQIARPDLARIERDAGGGEVGRGSTAGRGGDGGRSPEGHHPTLSRSRERDSRRRRQGEGRPRSGRWRVRPSPWLAGASRSLSRER